MIYTRSERITCLETLAHLASECPELHVQAVLAQQKNELVPYQWTGLISSPEVIRQCDFGQN